MAFASIHERLLVGTPERGRIIAMRVGCRYYTEKDVNAILPATVRYINSILSDGDILGELVFIRKWPVIDKKRN